RQTGSCSPFLVVPTGLILPVSGVAPARLVVVGRRSWVAVLRTAVAAGAAVRSAAGGVGGAVQREPQRLRSDFGGRGRRAHRDPLGPDALPLEGALQLR